MSARTDFSVLGVRDLTERMGAAPFSAPAVRVEADCDDTVMCFSRALDQRRPTERSSTAVFVPMDEDSVSELGHSVATAFGAAVIAFLAVALRMGWLA